VLVSAVLIAGSVVTSTARASSIVYAKGDAIYVTSPDGKQRTRLVDDRKYSWPSQADDGTIVALSDDNRLYRFSRQGKRLGKPVSTWLGIGGGQGFSTPYAPRVSPDGSKVAYSFFHTQGVELDGAGSQTEGATAYTFSDRYTPPSKLGIVKGWYHASWLGNDLTVSFAPGVGNYEAGPTTVAYHQLGHADPGASDDLANAYTWFSDPEALEMVFGEVSRAGDKLAVGEGGFDATSSIRLYSLPAKPPISPGAPAPEYRCELSGAPGNGYESLSWSPDGHSLAYAAGGSIFVVPVGDLAAGCGGLGAPKLLVKGGESPSWGPAGVAKLDKGGRR
jgi:hypothetical protein